MSFNQVGYFSKKMKKTTTLILIIELILLNVSFLFSQEDLLRIEKKAALAKNYTLKKSAINSSVDDFGVFSFKDTLYFSSNRKRRHVIQYLNEDSKYFNNIYFSPVDTTKQKNNNISLLSGAVNTIFNESFPFITKSGKTMYYTANLKKDGEVLKNLYILRATKANGIWGNVENLLINDKGFSNGQAVLNDAENIMYFVSDRDSDIGDTDIYVVTIHPDGSFGTPNKLDKNVNTAKQEISPFVTKNNELYFSSKGHGGFGGFDIFYIDLNEPDAKAINLGGAINSTADDFSFSMMQEKPSKGFLSSNKEGNLNIYQVTEHHPIKKILEEERKKYDAAKLVKKYQAPIIDHKIEAEKTPTIAEKVEKVKTRIAFYFDYNSSYLNEISKEKLNAIVQQLKADRTLKIALSTHTDSRGTNVYNMWLTKRRLERVKNYLYSKNVRKFQILGKAYGETKIVNRCIEGVSCSESDHQKNRRVNYSFF
jgi:outer membrane protein OmpA-like peptidoglycan-associated protein